MDDPPATHPFEPPLVVLTQDDEEQRDGTPSLLRARLLVLTAAVLWSTSGFFVKAPYLAGWPGPVIAFWRAAFACVVLWPLVRRPTWSWKLLARGGDLRRDELHLSDGDGQRLGGQRHLAAMHRAGVGAARRRVCLWRAGGVARLAARRLRRGWRRASFCITNRRANRWKRSAGASPRACFLRASSCRCGKCGRWNRPGSSPSIIWRRPSSWRHSRSPRSDGTHFPTGIQWPLSGGPGHRADGPALCALRPRPQTHSRTRGHRHRPAGAAARSGLGLSGLGR